MEDFWQANSDDIQASLERFELIEGEKTPYFDVHQVEDLFDYFAESNNLKEAKKILQLGIQQHPFSHSLQLRQAILMIEAGKDDDAFLLLKDLEKVEQNNCDLFLNLGWLYQKKGEVSTAISYYNQALLYSFEDELAVLTDICVNLNQQSYYNEVIVFLETRYHITQKSEVLLFELAYANDKIDEFETAREAYELLLDINPFADNAWYNLGIIYNKLQSLDLAAEAYEYAIAINPNHVEAYFNLGNCLAQQERFAEALDNYLEYAAFVSENILVYLYIGECLEQIGQYELAGRYYQKVTVLDENNAEAWYGLALTKFSTQKWDDCFVAFENAIRIDPMNADYWKDLGRACIMVDEIKESIDCFNRAIELDEFNTSAWLELIEVVHNSKNRSEFKRIANLISKSNNPDNAALHYLAVYYYYQIVRDRQNAFKHLEQAMELNSDDLKFLLQFCTSLEKEPRFRELQKKFEHEF